MFVAESGFLCHRNKVNNDFHGPANYWWGLPGLGNIGVVRMAAAMVSHQSCFVIEFVVTVEHHDTGREHPRQMKRSSCSFIDMQHSETNQSCELPA